MDNKTPLSFRARALVLSAFILLSGCSSAIRQVETGNSAAQHSGSGVSTQVKHEPSEASSTDFSKIIRKPLTPDQTKELIRESSGNFLFGQGLGGAAVNVAAIAAFPPYALYLLGNSAVEMAGFDGLYVTDALPDESASAWNDIYEGVTSVPGRLVAAVSGEQYRDSEEVRKRMNDFIEDVNRPRPPVVLSTYSYTPVMMAELSSYENSLY